MRLARYLLDDEEVVLTTRRHVATLLRPFLAMVIVIVTALIVGTVASPRDGGTAVDVAVGVGTALFVLKFLWRVWQWRATKTILSTRRVMQMSGVVARKVSSIPLVRLTDLTYRRPILGRVLGYGHLMVESGGAERGMVHLDYLPRPDDFYRALARLLGTNSGAGSQAVDLDKWDEADTGPLPRVIV